MIVAIDSQTLVWGVRKRDGTANQLQRAKWLFQQLEAQKAQIVLPAIALAEYLGHIDQADHVATIAAISERFLIMPFDVRCTSLAAQLFNAGNVGRPKGKPNSRKVLRADSLIVATAAMHGASIFYSHDVGCRSLASHFSKWQVRDLPDTPETFFDSDGGSNWTADTPEV